MPTVEKDLVCFSHLRWNFVFQRPQHLLTRFSSVMRVFYIEEPIYADQDDFLTFEKPADNIWVIVPHLNHKQDNHTSRQQKLLQAFFKEHKIENYIFWFYTPMAMDLSSVFKPELVIYDCMDELSAFKYAPPSLKYFEDELFKKADLVFTGGYSLYQAKKHRHENIHPFPSSIDKDHFQSARTIMKDPDDQANIPHPRIGFYGVIDERMNLDMIAKVAELKPEYHFVIIGPVVKIDHATLPRLENIHYLGGKSYQELPNYLAGWDIAMIPFELNESTRFISPTKTPEYLAAGKPVISSSIQDVVNPYGDKNLVYIADTAEAFIDAAVKELTASDREDWLSRVDEFLLENSWNSTWSQMVQFINEKLADKESGKKIYNINLKEDLYV